MGSLYELYAHSFTGSLQSPYERKALAAEEFQARSWGASLSVTLDQPE